MERRLERMEATQQQVTMKELARRIGPEVGIDGDELAAEAGMMLEECQRHGITTVDAMIEHVAAKDGISPEELRGAMDALGANWR
jgi:cytosine/adenosine deaminase-related metal-dependent hydrolase